MLRMKTNRIITISTAVQSSLATFSAISWSCMIFDANKKALINLVIALTKTCHDNNKCNMMEIKL